MPSSHAYRTRERGRGRGERGLVCCRVLVLGGAGAE